MRKSVHVENAHKIGQLVLRPKKIPNSFRAFGAIWPSICGWSLERLTWFNEARLRCIPSAHGLSHRRWRFGKRECRMTEWKEPVKTTENSSACARGRTIRIRWPARLGGIALVALTASGPFSRGADASSSAIRLQDDQAVSLRFFGSPDAELFTKELNASFQGVLDKSFYAQARDGFPAGFVSASLPGFPWAGTMWSRDGGTFMRELVMRGYYQHAALLAECLMHLVEKDQNGFYSFPEYFKGSQPGSGSELDGTTSIVIGMVLLWERLPNGDPTRNDIQQFLFQDASPLNGIKLALKTMPLVAGSGEFGCGLGVHGLCYNVAQNNLVRLALLAAAGMADESGDHARAGEYRNLAARIADGMEKYLVGENGAWIWCINAETMKPDPRILNAPGNKGIGSINGVASMDADVLGFDRLASSSPAEIDHSEKTFWQLYNTPLRKTEFDRFGIWTQFDLLAGGFLSSPSYGQGYAIQTMLLFDNMTMAGRALSWLANATYQPVPEYKLHRDSPYYFYERTYSPDAVGKIPLAEGCGALNLVNVSEPLKLSRLMLGVDDHSPNVVAIIPRIPPGWKGVEAHNWPIRTRTRIVRANILYQTAEHGAEFTLTVFPGEQIDDLKVRLPEKSGFVWRQELHARRVHLVTH